MRWAILAMAITGLPAMPAMAGEFAWCIKGCDFGGGHGDCSFATYRQCQATAAGRDAQCAANPEFNARAASPVDRSRPSRRRF